MRKGEEAYWDGVAASVIHGDGVKDNWLKRQLLNQYLSKCLWSGQKVLEIGVGAGINASLLSISCGHDWDYIGTDVSPRFVEYARGFGLNVIQADVLSLPEGPFTRILALDSLEHVHPDDRPEGYRAIAQRLVPGGLMFINLPVSRSIHDADFDHGIGLSDLVALEANGLIVQRYERYEIQYGNYRRDYAFAVLTK